METARRWHLRTVRLFGAGVVVAGVLIPTGAAHATPVVTGGPASVVSPAGFDTSPPLRDLARLPVSGEAADNDETDRMPVAADQGNAPDGALQTTTAATAAPNTRANFEGLSNQDNFTTVGGRVNPPDPSGAAGPNNYVEMVNLTFAVYDKAGTRLLGPTSIGALWAGFPVTECTDLSGDPVVVHDQFADRWILTQFTTKGLNFPNEPLNPFYECVAVSATSDPTGAYYRYAFTTGFNFPDYPKIGVWGNSYVLTTREFGIDDPNVYAIGVYGLERKKMIKGDPNARVVKFLLQDGPVPINLIGDGLLPPDVDGRERPEDDTPAPIVGTQDDQGPYGATFDALNVWDFRVSWEDHPSGSIELKAQLPVAPFDSIFPCGPVSARDCLPQPGITNRTQFLDILSYRQRPTFRLAYREFDDYASMVTGQSVEAAPGVAGMRWYEIRRDHHGTYTVRQQSTYAPADGVHRWMGSLAMDRRGNVAMGYSVVNGVDVFPGIRYTGRLAEDPLNQMTLAEGVIINGTGSQRTTNSRWGDYTTMTVDPVDDCTFWYVNEYYTAAGSAAATNGWQTRIASFRMPRC